MHVSNLLKVIGAFMAGVVVALGGALLYVRATDAVRSQPIAHEVAPAPAAPSNSGLDVEPTTPASTETAAPPTIDKAPTEVVPSQDDLPIKPVKKPTSPANPQKKKPTWTRAAVHEPSPAPKQGTIEVAEIRTPGQVANPGYITPANLPPPTINDPSSDSAPQPSSGSPDPAPVPAAPAPAPHVVTLEAGTDLVVRLGETLSTDHNYAGDTFRGTLDAPVVREGFIIADKGSKVLGRIAGAQEPGRVRGLADLNLTLSEINTTDGQRVSVQTTSFEKQGGSRSGQEAAEIGGGAALGAIIGAIAGGGKGAAIGTGAGAAAGTGAVLLSHGKPATISSETRITFRLASPVTITEKINN